MVGVPPLEVAVIEPFDNPLHSKLVGVTAKNPRAVGWVKVAMVDPEQPFASTAAIV